MPLRLDRRSKVVLGAAFLFPIVLEAMIRAQLLWQMGLIWWLLQFIYFRPLSLAVMEPFFRPDTELCAVPLWPAFVAAPMLYFLVFMMARWLWYRRRSQA